MLTTRQLMAVSALYEREYVNGIGETHRTLLLKGVREPCICAKNALQYCPSKGELWDCHGLGWTPTEDAWKWLKATRRAVEMVCLRCLLGFLVLLLSTQQRHKPG